MRYFAFTFFTFFVCFSFSAPLHGQPRAPLDQIIVRLTEGMEESFRAWNKTLEKDFGEYIGAVKERSLLNPKAVMTAAYTVKKGDNFWKVAKSRHIDIDSIVGANPYLPDLFARLNQKILVISRKGVLHRVERGETVPSILDRYNKRISHASKYVNQEQLAVCNDLPFFGRVKEGDLLFLPGVMPHQMSEEMVDAYELTQIFTYPLGKGGKYTSFMGFRNHPIKGNRRFHNGVDIKVPAGTRVCAARSGVVVESGWKGGYGKVVVLRHRVPNGKRNDTYETLYGHNSKIFVKDGSRVKQGQVIAWSGSTGMSTGPHLHFTIWKNNKIVDPLKFLWR